MKWILISLLATSVYASSTTKKSCPVKIEADDIEVHWEGFKNPLPNKKGVKGTLRNLGIKEEYKGESLEAILKGLKFNIDSRSVWSRNSMRDARLVKFFFGNMVSTMITGKLIEYKDSKLKMLLNMNGMAKEVVLDVKNIDDRFTATGTIDILEWGMNKSLAAINKACFNLHNGKTWSDVNLKLTLTYENDCD